VSATPFPSVEELVWALEELEGRPSDDVVGPLPHLLQTAELLAASHPEDPQLVAAGLVHDIASSLDLKDGDHGVLGAELVAPLLGARVGALVEGHVDAKRYLVATDLAYRSILSENSTTTLRAQGGGMDPSEVSAFRERDDWEAMVALRRADDAAKVPDAAVRAAAEWRALLGAVAHAEGPRRARPG
jgi:predicted HD phosphohydrolase